MITQYDIEYLVIFAILGVLFFKGLKPNMGGRFRPFVIDKAMSQALKGIACVFILMGHWGQRKFDMDMPWGLLKGRLANYSYYGFGMVHVFLWLWYVAQTDKI